MRKLLVIGGSGFLGAHFIRHILTRYPYYEVVNFDREANSPHLDLLQGMPQDNYTFFHADLEDPWKVRMMVREAQAVINFAADPFPEENVNVHSFMDTNVRGAFFILRESEIFALSRVIHISTDEVYGHVARGEAGEADRMRPPDPYVASRAAGELFFRSYWEWRKVPVIIVRPGGIFGPYQKPYHPLAEFIRACLEGKSSLTYHAEHSERDWTHVEDVCEALTLILHQGTVGATYNLASGNVRSNRELVKEIASLAGKTPPLFGSDVPARRLALNASRLRKLGWEPKKGFSQALAETVEWYRDNPEWVERATSLPEAPAVWGGPPPASSPPPTATS